MGDRELLKALEEALREKDEVHTGNTAFHDRDEDVMGNMRKILAVPTLGLSLGFKRFFGF